MVVSDAKYGEILEAAADLIEREGYDPFNYRNCDGAYCQAGAISAVIGCEPHGAYCGAYGPAMQILTEALHKLHPGLTDPIGASAPLYQRSCYKSREEIIRHMREVAAKLTEQERELVYA